MERLTTRVEDKVYYSKGKYPPTTLCAEMETWEVRECMKKLAEYEDTGLEPEEVEKLKNYKLMEVVALNNLLNDELKKYKKLEEQNRLIKLPCKIGDDLYIATSRVDGKGHVRKLTLTYRNLGNALFRLNNDIFVTREEAEKALGGLK